MADASHSCLAPLLTDLKQLRKEAIRRRKPFDEKSIQAAARLVHEAEGWKVHRTLNGLYRVNKKGVFNVPLGTKTRVEFSEGHA